MRPRLIKIPLASVKEGILNRFDLDDGLSALVFYDGVSYRAFDDTCPHMGGPLSRGRYCSRSHTLTCPWHGYVYSIDTLTLKENPNEKIWARTLAGADASRYETPAYRLRRLRVEVKEGQLLVEV